MRLSALINLPVLDADGQKLGRLHEIHATDGKVTELVYGPAGLFERLTGKAQPTKVPWSRVRQVGPSDIKLY
jgi:sporulation protein YlmC with PRC-barrel domain